MIEPRFVQIHTLTSYPAALLNRDDAGLAKRLPFGGAVRTRVSSQCLKRHWRMAEDEWALKGLRLPMGIRSRRILRGAVLRPLVEDEGFDEGRIREILLPLKGLLLQKKKSEADDSDKADPQEQGDNLDTQQAFMLGQPEIEYLKQVVRDALLNEQLRAAIINSSKKIKGKEKDKEAGRQVKQLRSQLESNLELLAENTRTPAGLESALFGRMVTSDLVANCDAAIHVAHNFTVHAEESESDYFTVVDDLKSREEGDDAGSAGIFDMELTSGLYYGYVVVDVPLLTENLTDDRELAAKVIEHLIHLIATVSPGAKLGATAPYAYAQLVLVELGKRQPRTLANAFRTPVELDANGRTLERATTALANHLAHLDEAYGAAEARRFLAVEPADLPAAQRLPLDRLAAWAADAVRAGTLPS